MYIDALCACTSAQQKKTLDPIYGCELPCGCWEEWPVFLTFGTLKTTIFRTKQNKTTNKTKQNKPLSWAKLVLPVIFAFPYAGTPFLQNCVFKSDLLLLV